MIFLFRMSKDLGLAREYATLIQGLCSRGVAHVAERCASAKGKNILDKPMGRSLNNRLIYNIFNPDL